MPDKGRANGSRAQTRKVGWHTEEGEKPAVKRSVLALALLLVAVACAEDDAEVNTAAFEVMEEWRDANCSEPGIPI